MNQPDDLPKPVLDALKHLGIATPTSDPRVAELLQKHEEQLCRKRARGAKYRTRDKERRLRAEVRAARRMVHNAAMQQQRERNISLAERHQFHRFRNIRETIVPFQRYRGVPR